MKEITSIYAKKTNSYALVILLILSSIIFSLIGCQWNYTYYKNKTIFSQDTLPLSIAMNGIHDNLHLNVFIKQKKINVSNYNNIFINFLTHADTNNIFPDTKLKHEVPVEISKYTFTTVDDNYFKDACFIGDSRTVGISQYANIPEATFLCKTSLSIYDYSKKKITYENEETSIQDVLSKRQFSKIYLMVGINECGVGTPESFLKEYSEVVQNIRQMQPTALIYIQGNLLVTEQKSEQQKHITNENISTRNKLISTLANQKDIFYIDINESELCQNGSLISDYTWDQVHIKAQYYEIWKDFLLNHAIVI